MNRLKLSCYPAWGILFLILIGNFYAPLVEAHAGRENYVWVNIEKDHVSGRFEINTKDLEEKLGIDLDGTDGNTLARVIATEPDVHAYLRDNFSLSFNDEKKKIEFLESRLFNEKAKFVQYHYRVDGVPENDLVFIRNTIFLSKEFLQNDPLHRSLVLVDHNEYRGLDFGNENTALVFGPHLQEAELNVANPPPILIWKNFFRQGLLHIWIGFDHMLFLFVLLLTAVLVLRGQVWEPAPRFADAFFNTVKIVTVFTISHSITLALAVLGLVEVPIAPIEAIIALSIMVVALNNVFHFFKSHTWLLIFVFGLAHGLGFASALGDLQFRNVDLKKILIMFNVGVEAGQIFVIFLVLPVLFYFRKYRGYRQIAVPALSWFAVILSGYWLGSRVGWWG
jgi:hypothetical protein